MAYEKTILCLAASIKHGGYCFAGKDLETGEWIRPVSNREDEEISNVECTRPNGTRATLLDNLRIAFIEPRPHEHQTENHLIDGRKRWKRQGQGAWEAVEEALDRHEGPLWLNGYQSWGFSNNKVPQAALRRFNNSLLLIRPSQLEIAIGPKGGIYPDADQRVVKAYFSHSGIRYTLAVTDERIRRRFRRGPDRREDLTGAIVCVSLGEIYKGDAYKLVAAVIEP